MQPPMRSWHINVCLYKFWCGRALLQVLTLLILIIHLMASCTWLTPCDKRHETHSWHEIYLHIVHTILMAILLECWVVVSRMTPLWVQKLLMFTHNVWLWATLLARAFIPILLQAYTQIVKHYGNIRILVRSFGYY